MEIIGLILISGGIGTLIGAGVGYYSGYGGALRDVGRIGNKQIENNHG